MSDSNGGKPVLAAPGRLDWPDPAARARPGIDGTATVLADGREWLLADYVPQLSELWDTLYRDNCIRQRYDPNDIRVAAFRLLEANYDLAPEEGAPLIAGVNPATLVPAVEAALFGPQHVDVTFSDWVIQSLTANGIDPATIDPRLVRPILNGLVRTERALPEGQAITAAVAGARLREARAMAAAHRQRDGTATPPPNGGD